MNELNKIEGTIRARPWPSIILLGFAAINLWMIVFKQTGAWVVFGVLLLVSVGVYFFCYSRINITEQGLELKNIYGKHKIAWQELSKTHVVYVRDGRASQYS